MLQVSFELKTNVIPNGMSASLGIDKVQLEKYQEKKPKYAKALKTLLALEANGYQAMYGWKKGNGFWIQYNGHTVIIENGRSSNECFFMVEEAIALLEMPI